MTLAPLRGKAMFILWSQNRVRNQITVVYENMVICGCCVQFLSKLENFYINRILNYKKVSFSKPPLPPFRQCPAKQQENSISLPPEGKTNRRLQCIKGGRKGGKNRRKHVSARY